MPDDPDDPHEQERRRRERERRRLEEENHLLKQALGQQGQALRRQEKEHHRQNWIWGLTFGVWVLGAYILGALWDVHIVDNYTPSSFLRVVLVILCIIWSYAIFFLPNLIERWFFPPPEK